MTLASRPASPGTNVPSRNRSAPLELYVPILRAQRQRGTPDSSRLEVLVGTAGEHRLVLRRGRTAPTVGVLVVDLDQHPVAGVSPELGLRQREGARDLVPVQYDLQVARLERLLEGEGTAAAFGDVLEGARVPHDHGALAVAGADAALEVGVPEVVV